MIECSWLSLLLTPGVRLNKVGVSTSTKPTRENKEFIPISDLRPWILLLASVKCLFSNKKKSFETRNKMSYHALYKGILSSSSPALISSWGSSASDLTSGPSNDTASAETLTSVWSQITFQEKYHHCKSTCNMRHPLWRNPLFQKAASGTHWGRPHSQPGLRFLLLASAFGVDITGRENGTLPVRLKVFTT